MTLGVGGGPVHLRVPLSIPCLYVAPSPHLGQPKCPHIFVTCPLGATLVNSHRFGGGESEVEGLKAKRQEHPWRVRGTCWREEETREELRAVTWRMALDVIVKILALTPSEKEASEGLEQRNDMN